MATCMTLTAGIARGCKNSAGGIKRIYVTNEEVLDWSTLTPSTGAGPITELSFKATADEYEAAWFVWQPNKYSSSWTETINVGDSGNVSYQQVVSVVFGQNEQDKRDAIAEAANGELAIIVEDMNGRMWMIGSDDNCAEVSGGNSTSGTAASDLNGWTVEFTCNANAPANEVQPEVGSDLEEALAAARAAN